MHMRLSLKEHGKKNQRLFVQKELDKFRDKYNALLMENIEYLHSGTFRYAASQ